MFAVRLDRLICNLREQLCPPAYPTLSRLYDGIVFNLRLELSYYKDKSYSRNKTIHILFYGNTRVFFTESEAGPTRFSHLRQPEQWKNVCNHDSCWQSDGLKVINDIYFQMADEINQELGSDNAVAPSQMEDDSILGGLLYKPFDLVIVSDAPDPNEKIYHKILKSITTRN